MYIYYPSCNFQRRFPEAAARVRAYLQTQADVRIAGCCHLTHDAPQAGDVIVTVCLSCMRTLLELRPDIPQISLFELLLTRADLRWPDLGGEALTVQDCFRARGRHGLQEAVRECLRRLNAVPAELDANRDEADFDGSFLLHDPYPQNLAEAPRYFGEYLPAHLNVLPEARWGEVFRAQAAKYGPGRIACYCNTCCAGAREGGADAVHLAELIFSGA